MKGWRLFSCVVSYLLSSCIVSCAVWKGVIHYTCMLLRPLDLMNKLNRCKLYPLWKLKSWPFMPFFCKFIFHNHWNFELHHLQFNGKVVPLLLSTYELAQEEGVMGVQRIKEKWLNYMLSLVSSEKYTETYIFTDSLQYAEQLFVSYHWAYICTSSISPKHKIYYFYIYIN